MGKATTNKRKKPGDSGSAGAPAQSFTPVNASEPPDKRRRSARGPKGDNGDKEFEENEDSVRVERSLLNSFKDTRIKSSGRSEINYFDTRVVPCLRCAGEISQFPDLICSTSITSTAKKCVDCCRKAKSCEPVPARLKESLARLEKAADRYLKKEISQADLDTAQAAFDLDKRCGTHVDKVAEAVAQKSPWKPVVSSTEELGASLSSAIDQLHSGVLAALKEGFNALTDVNERLITEVEGLRSDLQQVFSAAPEPAPESDNEVPATEATATAEAEGPVTPQNEL